MRKIISFMHISLDGFVAGPNGELNWVESLVLRDPASSPSTKSLVEILKNSKTK